jgi:hypothetical protein
MYDNISGWHAGAKAVVASDFRIAVPMKRVAEVCRLLSVHRIPHEIQLETSRTVEPRTQLSRFLREGAE